MGAYRPSPVRRVAIPKPDGGQRELGIPTVTDRLIQQALLQVLQPLLDPIFSEHSYGFRPGRRAHDAVLAAQSFVQSGHRVVVDVDLEKFFDRVNHDILVDRLQKRIDDAGMIRLVRSYLNAGIMDGGVVMGRYEGTPQGGPLSPLLANVLLDEVDRVLERRGHRFVRYADDCNVCVCSLRAGERVARRITDKAVLGLLRKYLQAGIMDDGLQMQRHEGTPQGGPLSPLLANVMLDEVERELERRGHNFVRYADDCNVYVRSIAAGERVLAGMRRCYAKLRLSVNEAKTAVAPVWSRKFLGYCFWVSKTTGCVRRDVAAAVLERYRQRVRRLTRRQTGRNLHQIARDLQAFMPGWKAYFRLTQTPSTLRNLDSWLRRRLRAIQLKFWRRGTTAFRALRTLGAFVDVAAQVAANLRRWWYASGTLINRVLTIAYFDSFGIPRLC